MNKSVVSNSVAALIKADMVSRFPLYKAQIEVNPRSAWMRGEVPAPVQKALKDAGFIPCTKGWYFVHEGVKAPQFVQAQTKKQTVKAEPKPEKVYAEVAYEVKSHVLDTFTQKYPQTQITLKGTWLYISGEKTREYKDALKADSFHWGRKILAWCRALTPEELNGTTPVDASKTEPEAQPKAKKPRAKKSDATLKRNVLKGGIVNVAGLLS